MDAIQKIKKIRELLVKDREEQASLPLAKKIYDKVCRPLEEKKWCECSQYDQSIGGINCCNCRKPIKPKRIEKLKIKYGEAIPVSDVKAEGLIWTTIFEMRTKINQILDHLNKEDR